VKRIQKKVEGRLRRKRRIKLKIRGTASRPRLSIFRSSKNIYAQIIDDSKGVTLVAASTKDKGLSAKIKGKSGGGNKEAAKLVGLEVAKKAKAAGIKKIVFDRGGYLYHGRVKALAEAAREGGLEF
jgi:large subunit ribosomal protein L18